MNFSLSIALMLLSEPSIYAFAPFASTSKNVNKGIRMTSEENSEDRRTFVTKVSLIEIDHLYYYWFWKDEEQIFDFFFF